MRSVQLYSISRVQAGESQPYPIPLSEVGMVTEDSSPLFLFSHAISTHLLERGGSKKDKEFNPQMRCKKRVTNSRSRD